MLVPSRPRSFFCTVVYGAKIVSSWSWPKPPAPLGAITPSTWNDWFRILIRSPTGSAPSPNRLSRTTDPRTATLAALRTWDGLKNAPVSTSQMRMTGSSTSVPSIWVFQFWFAAITWSRVLTPAAR